jgi:serine/threonine protein kinase
MLQACNGVKGLHKAGWLHRDIKPCNLLFCADGKLRVADVGVAKNVQDLTVRVRVVKQLYTSHALLYFGAEGRLSGHASKSWKTSMKVF